MRDPHLIQYDTYLKDLENAADPMRVRPYCKNISNDLKLQLRAMAVVAVFVAVVAFQPWAVSLF